MSNSRKVGGLGIVASTLMIVSSPSAHATSLDKDLIRRVVLAHRSEVRACHETARTRDPDIEGRVVIRFVIVASGEVESAEVESNTSDSVALGECIARAVETWEFPEMPGLKQWVVQYPFLLIAY